MTVVNNQRVRSIREIVTPSTFLLFTQICQCQSNEISYKQKLFDTVGSFTRCALNRPCRYFCCAIGAINLHRYTPVQYIAGSLFARIKILSDHTIRFTSNIYATHAYSRAFTQINAK